VTLADHRTDANPSSGTSVSGPDSAARTGADQTGFDQPGSDQPGSDQPGSDQAGFDQNPGARFTGRARLRLILILGALIAIGPLSIDMYLPALPRIAANLGTSESAIQLTLTGMLAGMGIGQLLVGPLSDAIGRRRPLIVGTAVHVVASLACLVAPTAGLLDAARVLQGLGAAAGTVLALAVIRDLFTDRAAATLLSRLMLVLSVSPILAPSLGSVLLRLTSWRGVFVALAVLGLAVTVATVFALPETLPVAKRAPLELRATLRSYGSLLSSVPFVGLMLASGLAMAGLFGFVSGASFVFQQQFGLSQQQFGLMFAASAVWLIAATQFNARLMRRFEPHQVLVAASVPAAVAAAMMFGSAATGIGGIAGILGALWVTLFGIGLILPNLPAVAMSAHGDNAGMAAALLGAAQFVVGAAIAPLVGVLGNNALAMATVIASGTVLTALALLLVARPWRLERTELEPGMVIVH
jgi:MFS transporter, DHA1 family, multidrug resistance protein